MYGDQAVNSRLLVGVADWSRAADAWLIAACNFGERAVWRWPSTSVVNNIRND